MKALRMSPVSRRQENGSCSGATAILHALHRRLCLELETCVARGPCTEAAERALQCRLQQRAAPERDVAAAVVLALRALPNANSNTSHTCGCITLSEWLGPANSRYSGNSCQSCRKSPWPERDSPRREFYEYNSSSNYFMSAPSLLMVRDLLERGTFSEAVELAGVLLRAGADPNDMNYEGRSLLSYSIQQLDDCIALTRLLLNSGASVWLGTPKHPNESDQSAFAWLLRSLILKRKFEHCNLTLNLLARVMGGEPIRMRALVFQTMLRHSHCPKVLGPIFQQVKDALAGYWTQPQGLQYSCWKVLRKSMGPSRLSTSSTSRLGLPPTLQRYLLMDDL